MIYHSIEQNTPEWMELRRGKFTSSTFSDLFAKPSTLTYQKAIYKVVYERMTGEQAEEGYKNSYMERGHAMEVLAKNWYEQEKFCLVDNGGFCEPEDELLGWIGDSPDGLVEQDGTVEIKSKIFNTMIDCLLNKKIPTTHYWQIHGHIYIADRAWCDYVIYHPKLTPFIIRVNRDEKVIAELKEKLKESIEYAQSIIEKLK